MNISNLSEKELCALNRKIVERIRFLQQEKAHKVMLEFNVGEAICFDNGDEEVYGVITKFNKKTVSVLAEGGTQWNIHPSFLKKITKKENIRDVTPTKNILKIIPQTTTSSSPSRNATCPCGSGKKYKRCCLQKQSLSVQ